MQMASKGLTRYDVVHGVGDGGGENEGVMDGVHTHAEGGAIVRAPPLLPPFSVAHWQGWHG